MSTLGVYRPVWQTAAALLAACAVVALATGSLIAPIVWASLLGIASAWKYAVEHEGWRRQSGYGRRVACAGLTGAAVVLVGAGLIELLGGIGFVLLVLLVVTSPPCVRIVREKLGRRGSGQRSARIVEGYRPAPRPAPDRLAPAHPARPMKRATRGVHSAKPPTVIPVASPPPGYQSWTQAELCYAWRHSFIELAETPAAERLAIVQLRQAYLDEIQRRDLPGFARWLAAGARAASDPAKYLGADPGPGADHPVRDPTAPLAGLDRPPSQAAAGSTVEPPTLPASGGEPGAAPGAQSAPAGAHREE